MLNCLFLDLGRKRLNDASSDIETGLAINVERLSKNVESNNIQRSKPSSSYIDEIQSKYEENYTAKPPVRPTDVRREDLETSSEYKEVEAILIKLGPKFSFNIVSFSEKYVIEIKHVFKPIRYVLEVEKNSLNVINNEKITNNSNQGLKICSQNSIFDINLAMVFSDYIKDEIEHYL
jgi:hypothetical protein